MKKPKNKKVKTLKLLHPDHGSIDEEDAANFVFSDDGTYIMENKFGVEVQSRTKWKLEEVDGVLVLMCLPIGTPKHEEENSWGLFWEKFDSTHEYVTIFAQRILDWQTSIHLLDDEYAVENSETMKGPEGNR